MYENQKEYIEFRLIILGDTKVGKKSFIERLLNIPSTNIIRNKELEHQYKKLIFKLRKKYEKEKKILDMIKVVDKKTKRREELLKRLLNKSLRKKKLLSENDNNKTQPKSPEKKEDEKIEELEDSKDNNNFILKVTTEEQFYSKKYTRPPIPELPGKIFNINNTKICIKPYYILSAEKIDFNYNPEIDDSENEYDTELNISFKGIKNDVKKIISNKKPIIELEKLKNYRISICNIFIFLYDMSDFFTFDIVAKYFKYLENSLELSKMDNAIIFLIGNKKDKKVLLDLDQVNSLNTFLKENIPFYEISTRLYFNFTKFFIELILRALSIFHQDLLELDKFKLALEKIANNKQTFAKSKREIYQKLDSFVGPKYYANIYGFSNQEELSESFNVEKMRFNKKIFVNKTGPKYVKSKSTKDINLNINVNDINDSLLKLEQQLNEIKGGILNKPIKGYQFGIVSGKLNLLKLRKKLISQRNKSFKDSLEEGSSLFTQNANTFRIKGEEYLEEAKKRRQNILEKKILEKKEINDELNRIHLMNLEKLENERNIKREKLLASQTKNGQSLSFPDLFTSFSNINNINNNNNYNYTSNINTKENKEEMNKTSRQNYTTIKHFKNKQYLQDYYFKLKMIKATHKDTPSPGPNSYDIRRNISDKNKGFSITGKRKELTPNLSDPSFPDLKDEFDIIVLKGKKYNNKIESSPRFKKLEKEKDRGPYPNDEVWKKWELNRSDINKNKVKYFMENINEKKKNQMKKVELIKQQTEEIQRLKREILIRKGYEDPSEIKSINYSQVEFSSPKFTIKGRHPPKIKQEPILEEPKSPEDTNTQQLLKEDNYDNNEKFISSPNINYVKPKLPSVVFGKAQRFDTHREYQGSLDLFQDGVFALKTQQNFSCKSPYDNPTQRTSIQKVKEKSPSPADYVIKSIFEIIAEKGKKTSEIRNNIKLREMIRNFNGNKNAEKKYIKIHKIKKIKVEENKITNDINDITDEKEKI